MRMHAIIDMRCANCGMMLQTGASSYLHPFNPKCRHTGETAALIEVEGDYSPSIPRQFPVSFRFSAPDQ